MLGDGRLRVSGAVGQRVHGEFAVAHEALEDRAAGRIGYTYDGALRLRANGWRGSGYVRWQFEENRGFLRALNGLSEVAGRIGETGWHDTTHNPLVIDLSTLRHTSGFDAWGCYNAHMISHTHIHVLPPLMFRSLAVVGDFATARHRLFHAR